MGSHRPPGWKGYWPRKVSIVISRYELFKVALASVGDDADSLESFSEDEALSLADDFDRAFAKGELNDRQLSGLKTKLRKLLRLADKLRGVTSAAASRPQSREGRPMRPVSRAERKGRPE